MNKLEIIEQIEQTKRNKNKFNNLHEYNDKINLLYHELSNIIGRHEIKQNPIKKDLIKQVAIKQDPIKQDPIKQVKIIGTNELNLTDDEKIEKIEQDIMYFDSNAYFFENSDVKLLSKKYALFDLFLIENNLMITDLQNNYTIQTEPIIDDFNKQKIVKDINFLLFVSGLVHGKINKVIISLIIYDLILKNFNFCLKYPKFKITCADKLNTFNKEKEYFNLITNKYNLGIDIVDKWIKVFDNFNL